MYKFQSGIIINGPLESNGDQGAAGEVLTSAGTGNPPVWGNGGGTVALDVYLASNITSLTANSPIKFDTEVYDLANAYDPSTGIFTAPSTGIYVITTSVVETNSSGSVFPHQTQILVNSNPVSAQSSGFPNGTYCVATSIVIRLTASDQVSVVLNDTIGSGPWTNVQIDAAASTRFGISSI